jgi:hypothetical protein
MSKKWQVLAGVTVAALMVGALSAGRVAWSTESDVTVARARALTGPLPADFAGGDGLSSQAGQRRPERDPWR